MDKVQDVFAALADPTRARILLLVRDLQLSVGELADILDQSQPRVSRHVRILAEAGLVRRQKEGAWVFVGGGDPALIERIHDLISNLCDGVDPIGAERARLAQVRAERQRRIDGWFEANAGEWDLLRRLGGQDAAVEAALVAAAGPNVGRLLDIGTGTGRVLELLAGQTESATGIDRSPEMLRLARGKLAGRGNQSAELRQSDMGALPFADASFETVTLHHVLHFADEPAAVIAEAARLVVPGGRLLVADYAAHELEELRTRFHHSRLGFEDEALADYMQAAGLSPRLLSSHPGPELTVNLWEGRR
ncbi:metalloregulator ArsR/SmtB family transcription factor [Sandaracinobacter neustonicus]|uniref:Metalloregulator ArsR/SmtB family transcription factor n=1 Tax=Sandaracinobacter neustonicus TaxID=1715348 RepID=A0A501XFL1_9SPHN|nr:metalloregulator ArsR/SmtB family transcription factor [Sandaracinobacter neustonicus]TPE59084.1 metalloregulator ArsR/SmtB family transcription factor [Sandaracinobacter neustonicus]